MLAEKTTRKSPEARRGDKVGRPGIDYTMEPKGFYRDGGATRRSAFISQIKLKIMKSQIHVSATINCGSDFQERTAKDIIEAMLYSLKTEYDQRHKDNEMEYDIQVEQINQK